MDSNNFTIVLTGAAGNIGSILMFMLMEDNIFGGEKSITLRLIDLPQCLAKLKGLAMEIEDCLFPRLKSVEVLSEAKESFKDADCVILVAGKPRGLGMERRDLLEQNSLLFKHQAELCEGMLKPSTKVLIVANPCNTNALVFSHFLPSLDKHNISALSFLDQNRAKAFISQKLQIPNASVKNLTVFGNHSNTMVVDISRAFVGKNAESKTFYKNDDHNNCDSRINNAESPLRKLLPEDYVKTELQELVRKRGGEIIQAKGNSSAYSAAKAIIDHLKAWYLGSSGEIISMAVIVDKILNTNEKLCVSLPVVCNNGSFEVVDSIAKNITDFEAVSMDASIEELLIEKAIAFELLNRTKN